MLEKLCKKVFLFQDIKNKILALEIHKCTRESLLGNLFVAGRIFFGLLRTEDIQYFHSLKLEVV